eukprot:jgi/Chlat1/6314/Chrsp44S05791
MESSKFPPVDVVPPNGAKLAYRVAPLRRMQSRSAIAPQLNPFVNESLQRMSLLTRLSLLAGGILLFPFRLLVLLLCSLLYSLFAKLAVAFHTRTDPPTPLKGWRTRLLKMAQLVCRPALGSLGFWQIKVIGQPATEAEAPIVVVAPHATPIDFLVIMALTWSSFVSLPHPYPVVRTGLKAMQCIIVDHKDHTSRKNAVMEIKRRALSNGEWPRVMIFPEGTTHSANCLITFKTGAFTPGVPVQPVILRYQVQGFDLSWCGKASMARLLLCAMCQWVGHVTVEFLPVHTPTPEEKASPELFAANVRSEMATALCVPVTDHSVEDTILQLKAKGLGLPTGTGVVAFADLQRRTGLTREDAQRLLADFAKMDRSRDGKVTIEEFASYLNLPITDYLQDIFQLYDADKDGELSFREFLIGMCLVTGPAVTDATMKLVFSVFDQDGSGRITQEKFTRIVHAIMARDSRSPPPEVTEQTAAKIFLEADANGDGLVTYDEFVKLVKEKPQYLPLLQRAFQTDEADGAEDLGSVFSGFTGASCD